MRSPSPDEGMSFNHIIDIIKECHGNADPEHELIAGILAAAFARKRGGGEALTETLGFVGQLAQTIIKKDCGDQK